MGLRLQKCVTYWLYISGWMKRKSNSCNKRCTTVCKQHFYCNWNWEKVNYRSRSTYSESPSKGRLRLRAKIRTRGTPTPTPHHWSKLTQQAVRSYIVHTFVMKKLSLFSNSFLPGRLRACMHRSNISPLRLPARCRNKVDCKQWGTKTPHVRSDC